MIFYKKVKHGPGSGGFTLIELLVVIAIIGILSAVVLASLNSARQKSRDAKRVADLKQLQLALELYYDDNTSTYPATLAPLETGGYIPVIAKDPNGVAYSYAALGTIPNCTTYHLGATLENANNPALQNDSDHNSTGDTICVGGAGFDGAAPVYDLTP
jgi:prepilin-type N-terminal cleavage/methylation domain-containing protein